MFLHYCYFSYYFNAVIQTSHCCFDKARVNAVVRATSGLLSCFYWVASPWTAPPFQRLRKYLVKGTINISFEQEKINIQMCVHYFTLWLFIHTENTQIVFMWRKFRTLDSILYLSLQITGKRLLCRNMRVLWNAFVWRLDNKEKNKWVVSLQQQQFQKFCNKAVGRRPRWYLQVHPRTWRQLWPWHRGDRRLTKSGVSLLKAPTTGHTVTGCFTLTDRQLHSYKFIIPTTDKNTFCT